MSWKQIGFDVFNFSNEDSEENNNPYYMTRHDLATYTFPEHPVDAVVVGTDTHLNFRKLCVANVLLQMNPEALLVATNMDNYDLVGAQARHIPANGSTIKYLEYTSNRNAANTVPKIGRVRSGAAWTFLLLRLVFVVCLFFE